MGSASALDLLAGEVTSCRACPRLVEWRERAAADKKPAYARETYWGRPIPGFGDPGATVMVVGLAPAAHGGNRTGRMFTGDRSGNWLFRALWRAGYANKPTSEHRGDGLVLSGAYVTAAVRCAPPANKPTTGERDNCMPYLAREIELLGNLTVLVALGGFAYQVVARVLGLRPRPRFSHGTEAVAPGGRVVICSYHPSQQNTFTGKLTEPMLDAVFERARVLAGGDTS